LIEPVIKRSENSVFVPTGPGLGITVNEDRLAKYISAINHYD